LSTKRLSAFNHLCKPWNIRPKIYLVFKVAIIKDCKIRRGIVNAGLFERTAIHHYIIGGAMVGAVADIFAQYGSQIPRRSSVGYHQANLLFSDLL
jgi:hypothetical protein